MSDIKLFRIADTGVAELPGSAVQVEKSLQTLVEANLEAILGVRFLASEHATGPVHGGRIDTLGIDEDGTPVIVEYKRAVNENVISQGLFYLDWLLDHRGEFELLVLKRLGAEAAKAIDWSAPRLLCIAGDFTRYDQHAVKQIARNIELIRYRRFGADLLMLELVHAPRTARASPPPEADAPSAAIAASEAATKPTARTAGDPYASQRIAYRIAQADAQTRDLYEAVRAFILGLGDDVQEKELLNYIAFKRLKNFACVEVYPQARAVLVFLKVDPALAPADDPIFRDVTNIGHFGTGDLELRLRTLDDLARAEPFIRRSYEGS